MNGIPWESMAGVLFGGSLLTGLYLWQHDLIACMIAHALFDLPVLILPPLLARKDRNAAGNQAAGAA